MMISNDFETDQAGVGKAEKPYLKTILKDILKEILE